MVLTEKREYEIASKEYKLAWNAVLNHRTHKNKMLDFEKHYYMKQILFDTAKYKSIMKSTQNGISELLVLIAINKASQGRSVFYVLPTDKLVGRFVKNRFDKSIEFSSVYKRLITEERRQAYSIGLKHIGLGAIAFVGSNTPTVFTEFPADDLIIDELDRCNLENLEMAGERLSHSEDPRIIKISNPTIQNYGIDNEWKNSCQYLWHIKCESCNEWFVPDFFHHVVKKVSENDYLILDEENWKTEDDIRLKCKCGAWLNRFYHGEWVATYPDKKKSGYHLSKLFSSNASLKSLVERFNEGLYNDTIMQRFWNADLGLPFTASGSKLTEAALDECVRNYRMEDYTDGICVAGVDVGAKLHIRVSELMEDKTLKAVYIGSVERKDELFDVLKKYRIKAGVIDANPETRLSKEVCAKMRGIWLRCYYHIGKTDVINLKDKSISVDRTQALDAVKEHIVTERILLPKNARNLPEYYDHMTASTRVFKEDKQRFVWEEGNKADHFFHSEAYNLLAKRIIISYNV